MGVKGSRELTNMIRGAMLLWTVSPRAVQRTLLDAIRYHRHEPDEAIRKAVEILLALREDPPVAMDDDTIRQIIGELEQQRKAEGRPGKPARKSARRRAGEKLSAGASRDAKSHKRTPRRSRGPGGKEIA